MLKKIISIILVLILSVLQISTTLAEVETSANVETGLVNVALNKTIGYDTTGGTPCTYPIENIIDGDIWTFGELLWANDTLYPALIIDLEDEYSIEEIKLYALPDNPSPDSRDRFWIDLSTDKNTWINVCSRNNDVNDEFSFSQQTADTLVINDFGTIPARYVRIKTYSYSVWMELEVYAKMPQLLRAEKLNKNIYLEFDEKMDIKSITTETLSVYEGDNKVGYTVSVYDNMVVLSLDKIVENAIYSIVLTDGIKSILGDSIITDGEKILVTDILAVDDFSLSRTLRKASATAVVKNNADTEKMISLIVAQYSPFGILENIDICNKKLVSGETQTFESVVNSGVDFDVDTTLKAFIWNVTDNKMIPVTDVKELKGGITEFYVSPTGNDDNIGTLNMPFATIERAMEEVRLHNSDMTDDITIYLKGGVYQLEDTISFTSKDSGTNGYDVIYKSYPGEEAVLSGGIKVENWIEGDNGIWYANVSGIDSALLMSVDGVATRRAQSEEWIDIETLFPEEREIDTEAGLTVLNSKYVNYQNQSDIQLRFIRGWKSYLLNVESITQEGEMSKFTMRQPGFYFAEYNNDSSGYEAHFYNIEDNNNFKIENAFEELDVPGEFYYNSSEKRVYYMPREGENLNTSDVRIAKLDKLIDISGDNNNNKVKNIAFENITFSDGNWSRAAEYGFVTDQAQMLMYDNDISTKNPGYTFSPANILLNSAEDIRFENNEIRNMGSVGIGLYSGADNIKIVGNAFYDIGDSAVTVSSPDQVYEEEAYFGRNIASGKAATAGSVAREFYTPNNALDNNPITLWAPVTYSPSWWQVDLEEQFEIDRIELDYRTDGIEHSFDSVVILASNDPEFNTYTELQATITENDKGVVFSVANSDKFRYVRLKHQTDNAHWVIADVRIINESMEYAPSVDICDNNLINNNYITRVGAINTAAPGMQLYYVKNTEVSNNYLYDIPYSGISLGWGWSSYPDSTTCADNSIKNNKIEMSSLVTFDGGAIYLNGQQQGTVEVSGNHIITSINGSGVYLDTYSCNAVIENNVVEDVLENFCSATDSFDNVWRNNYVSSVLSSIRNESKNSFETPVYFVMGIYPEAALSIVENAGLTDEYNDIVTKAGINHFPVSVTDYYNNILNDTDNDHILTPYVKNLYNTSFVDTCKKWNELVSYEHFSAKMKLWNVYTSIKDSSDRAVIFEQCKTLRNAMYEFANSVK